MVHNEISVRPLLAAVFLAVCFWGWIFGLEWGNFWWKMTSAGVVLSGFSLWFNRRDLRADYCFTFANVGLGVAVAIALYAVFWAGGLFLGILFPGSRELIGSVYATKTALPEWTIALLLVCIIGPAEEIFWRGLVQKHLITATNSNVGLILAALIYALVHLWAKNGVLVLAAFVCGLIWGWLYLQRGSLIPVIVSHALWDVAIFIIAPLD